MGSLMTPKESQRIVEAMDEILIIRQNRIDRGFDLATELAAHEFEARDAALHFIAHSAQVTTREAKIRALAKAGGAILTMIEVQIERAAQERAAKAAAPREGELTFELERNHA